MLVFHWRMNCLQLILTYFWQSSSCNTIMPYPCTYTEHNTVYTIFHILSMLFLSIALMVDSQATFHKSMTAMSSLSLRSVGAVTSVHGESLTSHSWLQSLTNRSKSAQATWDVFQVLSSQVHGQTWRMLFMKDTRMPWDTAELQVSRQSVIYRLRYANAVYFVYHVLACLML